MSLYESHYDWSLHTGYSFGVKNKFDNPFVILGDILKIVWLILQACARLIAFSWWFNLYGYWVMNICIATIFEGKKMEKLTCCLYLNTLLLEGGVEI